ncbi:hypothetical protein B0H17DRAFT_1212296 [Mycena rosella]|uniref:Uncharacterized protein n=1 Tax=Mycena rosella TaxID=1033263 RepID=A0AAD7CSG3_MYCRO|nr:hypothetical protein B0H17DRAFT_1212296 [Mycena rosella]
MAMPDSVLWLKKQKKRKHDEPTGSTQVLGRGIRKLAVLYGEISHIIAASQQLERDPYPDDHGIDKLSEDVTEEELEWLEEKCRAPIAKMDPADAAGYFTLIQKGVNDACSEDLRRVTRGIANRINAGIDKCELAVFDHTLSITTTNEDGKRVILQQRAPTLHPSDRSTRGSPHNICGSLLSTTDTNWNDARHVVCLVSEQIWSGAIPLGANYFAHVFYEGIQGDPHNVEKGFLQSRYLTGSYKSVFTSPSSVEDEEGENTPPLKKTKSTMPIWKPVAQRLGMNGKVMPRSIAYIAILVYFTLTNASGWTPDYYNILLLQMCNFIVDFFEAPTHGLAACKCANDLLTWWNKYTLPLLMTAQSHSIQGNLPHPRCLCCHSLHGPC